MSQSSWPLWYEEVPVSNLNTLINNLIARVKDYTKEAVEHLIIATLFYCLFCIFLYAAIVGWQLVSFQSTMKSPRRVLFVIAHPDDECMFFGPTIMHFTRKSNCLVYLLCLSIGANYGMGRTRKNELYKACKVLGLDDSCIIVQSHTLLPDCMEENWPTELVAHIVLNCVEVYNIDTLITFDRHGVSKHSNHCSIYYAVALLISDRRLPEDCKVYVLESVNFIRKYWLILDIPLSFVLSRIRYILNGAERGAVISAMYQHKSQLVWYRRLYLMFSRYTFLNTLQEMSIVDIELDMQIEEEDAVSALTEN